MANDVEVLVTELRVDMRRYEAAMRRQARITETTAGKVERRYRQMNRQISRQVDQMSQDVRRAIAAIAIGVGTREVFRYADAWTEAGNRIAAAGTPLDDQDKRLRDLSETAIETRSAFESTAALYARLGIATENLKDKEYDLLKVTNLVNKATVAGGASTAERNSTVLQLSQALASGQLMGEELRSLRENAPLLLKAIADEFGVTIGELKELGAQGKLTSERILDGILNAEKAIEERFAKTTVTIGDSFQNLQTRVIEYIGTADDSLGMTEKVSGAVMHVADNVESYAEALVVAGAALTGALGAQAAVAAVNALSGIAAGAQGAAAAMKVLRAASAFMFGPAGFIIGVSAAAGALAYLAIKGNAADQAIEELVAAQKGANDALAATKKYVDEDLLGRIGESADDAKTPIFEMAGALRDVVDALNDATIAQFINDVSSLESSISDARAAIEEAEDLRKQKRDSAGLRVARVGGSAEDIEAARAGVATPELDQQIGAAKATLAGLEERRANIGISLFADGAGKEITDLVLSGDVAGASKKLKETISGATGGGGNRTGGGTGGEDSGEVSNAIEGLKDQYRDLFETEREQVARIRDEQLAAIEASKRSEQEKADLREQANAVYQRQIADIREAEGEAFDAWVDQELEKDKIKQDQRERELAIIDELANRRDELAERGIAIAERQYEAERDRIQREIEDTDRQKEALQLLEENHLAEMQRIREELLGEGESSDNEIERVRAIQEGKLEALREGLEQELITREEFAERRAELEQQTEDKINAIKAASIQQQLYAGQELFNALSGAAKAFAGEQSSTYKALFAVEKAFAVASAIINIQQGVSRALSLPFPANLAAAATVAAQGASVVANIQSTVGNFAQGGVDIRGPGSGRSDSIPANISRGESVITAAGTAANKNVLQAINAGANVEAALASTRGGASLSIGSTQLVVQGDIGTAETLQALQLQLDERDRRLQDDVLRWVSRERTFSTPRHKRD